MSFTREAIAASLANGPVHVTFTKVDGSERKMLCTQSLHMIPEDKRPKHSGEMLTEVPYPGDVLRVYDLEASDWRSFRVSSVTALSLEGGPSTQGTLLNG